MRSNSLALLLSLLVFTFSAQAIELQVDDSLYATADNDLEAQIPNLAAMGPLSVGADLLGHVNLYGKFLTFSDVISSLTPYLESQFDTFIIGNTATEGASTDLVPFQHVRVLHKKDKTQPLFLRTEGVVTGIHFNNVESIAGVPDLVPISSGKPGNNGIRTFSGIFRVSTKRSKSHLSTGKEAPMSYAVYIDARYTGGRESGIAIHGTPTRNHKLLGVSRASHGCLRTLPIIAKEIYTHVMSPEMWSEELPKFDKFENFPSEEVMSGQTGTEPGTRTLFIIFNGHGQVETAI
ncbi:MAG: L,D-transpeptidase [Bdellovibrionaceae bacterium]|nr:L,D-transpeptidase [Pseudobdellovibrionaceae bacterium]